MVRYLLDIHKQSRDIYNTPSHGGAGTYSNDLDPLIHELSHINAQRLCFFVIWVNLDDNDPRLPVLESHVTLVVIDRNEVDYTVYKYNSAFRKLQDEHDMDMVILELLRRVQAVSGRQYNLVPTASWCPKALQDSSKLCSLYVFHIYYSLNKNRQIKLPELLTLGVQSKPNIDLFIKQLAKEIPGAGI